MKNKERKQREAQARQESYNNRVDEEFKSKRTDNTRAAFLKKVSPSQQSRLAKKFPNLFQEKN